MSSVRHYPEVSTYFYLIITQTLHPPAGAQANTTTTRVTQSFHVRDIHRDISIGRILKKETDPGLVGETPSPPFAYPAIFEEVLKALDEHHETRSGDDATLWEDLRKAKDVMEERLKTEV